ncbi:TRAP transporter substrate-binding protein DctP [Paracoccus sp. MBLB3053]|uniref:TRAP transporter substrate-binding protein DctP n=1 Tax=Paracoccus aurantius TaxID=3073814 RepID=A0ABU2HZE0_9RHOB|nr:TRAP transporter substrate-binding protein DctP [Paracoccus sp. MBLB3053]MDS9469890.1 TRAP transporter substrate-binding protein DctP [Paracoccus sp. MBLB3053]
MNRLKAALAASAVMLAPAFAAPALAQTQLIFNSYLPPHDELYQIAIRDFAAAIEEESGGEIKITIPDTTLAPSDRQYEMVRDGIADMAIVSTGGVPQLVTMNKIGDLPFNSPSARAASIALWETYNKYFLPFDEFKGVKVLSTSVLPGRQILSVGKLQAESVADLKGAKLWSPPGALSETVKKLGAVPVNSEFTDLQEYVTKGTVDAMVMAPNSAKGARVLEYVTGMTEVPGGLGSLSFAVFISQERWDQLTSDEQQAIERAAKDLPARSGAAADAVLAKLAPEMEKVPTVTLEGAPLDEFRSLLEARIEEWKERAAKKGLDNPDEVLAFYREILARENKAGGS